jgi:hypothetical protein
MMQGQKNIKINIMCPHSLAIKETISKSVLPPPDKTNNTASSAYKREKEN